MLTLTSFIPHNCFLKCLRVYNGPENTFCRKISNSQKNRWCFFRPPSHLFEKVTFIFIQLAYSWRKSASAKVYRYQRSFGIFRNLKGQGAGTKCFVAQPKRIHVKPLTLTLALRKSPSWARYWRFSWFGFARIKGGGSCFHWFGSISFRLYLVQSNLGRLFFKNGDHVGLFSRSLGSSFSLTLPRFQASSGFSEEKNDSTHKPFLSSANKGGCSDWNGDWYDGRNSARIEAGSLSHHLQSFEHPRWCRSSSIHSIEWWVGLKTSGKNCLSSPVNCQG